jgi:hypothetical protein
MWRIIMFDDRMMSSRTARGFIQMLLVLFGLALSVVCHARGGQAADDCPPGSKDPDCAVERHKP